MDVTLGEDYAYHSPGSPLSQPLRATVCAKRDEFVSIDLYHPDQATPTKVTVPIESLAGRWHELPGEVLPEADRTWAEIAEQNYRDIQSQRVLVARLSQLGIDREARTYGQRRDRMQGAASDLRLRRDELTHLLTMAERYVAQNLDTVVVRA